MKRVVGFIFLLVLTTSFAVAGEIVQNITLSPNNLEITSDRGFDVVRFGINPYYDDVAGYPCLPELPFYVVIPPTATVTSIEVLSADEKTLPGEYMIMPVQHGRPFSVPVEPPFIEPNKAVYGSKAVFPDEIIKYMFTGKKGGFRIGTCRLYPVRYLPAEKKLVFYTNLKVKITYQEGTVEPIRQTERQIAMHRADLMGVVSNYQDVARFAPHTRTASCGSTFLPAGNYEHVILTAAAFKDTLQLLANWRTKQGIPSKVVCIESVNVYPGRDIAEKMRNFLRDADTTWGVNFVFIGRQDFPIRQYRNCWALYPGYTDTLPCDMYYSDLWRGTNRVLYDWDGNRNGTFGQANDTIDYWADIYPGMVPFDNVTQVSNWVRKLFRHETSADTTFFAKDLLVNGVTFSDSFLNRIAEATPAQWIDCKAYYSGAGNVTPSAALVRDSVNRGYGYVAVIAHGDPNSIFVPDAYTATHVAGQTNTNLLSTIIAVSCHPGAFDQAANCLAETMAVHPNGFINIMLNSRYGWVAVAELYNTYFMHNILPKGSHSDTLRYPCFNDVFVGQALARVKDRLISKYPRPGIASDSSRWRWESYEKNLFGDPAVMCHTTRPVRTLGVTHATTIRTGSQNFTVTVNVTDYAPMESVLVCLWKGTEVYARGYTNAAGSVTLAINPTTAGTMSVTGTKRNYKRYDGSASVTTGIAENNTPVIPAYFALGRSEPNPFGRFTTIRYQLPKPVHSRLAIYDATGRVVTVLVNRNEKPGWYTVNWNGKNDAGVECAAGIYFYRIEAGNFADAKSLVIVR